MGHDVNDFFDFGGSGDSYEYDERNTSPIYDPSQNKELTSTERGIVWALLAVVFALIVVLFIGKIIGDQTDPNRSGIKAVDDTYIMGLTYSQLSGKTFKVTNTNRVDMASQATWFLNGTDIGSGASCNLDMNYMKWGENLLTAVTPANSVEFTIQLEKGQSSDEVHNLMSMMIDYPDEWYVTGDKYSTISYSDAIALARADTKSVVYNDNYLEQHIVCGDVELIYCTPTGYNLNLFDVSKESPSIFTETVVDVYGSWENVVSVSLAFKSPYGYIGSYIAYKYDPLTQKIEKLPSDNVRLFNKSVYVDIYESGCYTILPEHIDISNVNFDDIKQYNVVYAAIAMGTYETVVSSNRADIIDDIILDNYENFNHVKVSDLVGTEPMGLINKVMKISNSPLLAGNNVIVLDFSEVGFIEANTFLTVINDYWYDTFDTMIVINCPIVNLKSIMNINSDIIEVQNSNLAMQEIEKIANRKTFESPSEFYNIQYDGNDIQVLTVADSGFDVSKHGYNLGCTFNEELQGSESYGCALFSKLIFTGDMRADFVNEKEYLPYEDYGSILPGCNIKDYNVPSNITSMDVKALIENGLNNTNLQISEVGKKSAIYILTLQQLNNTNQVYKSFDSIPQNGSPSYIVEYISEKMAETGPVLANISNSYGDSTVLITKVTRAKDKVISLNEDEMPKIVYYIHMYDPLNPSGEQIAKLEVSLGNIGLNIGYHYEFEYKGSLIEYSDMSIIDSVTVAENKEISYSE